MLGSIVRVGLVTLLYFYLMSSISGCAGGGGVSRSEWLEHETRHQEEHQRQETALRNLETRLDNDKRERASEKWCKDTKVLEFVKELQLALPGTCTGASLQSSLLFMKTQAYAISNLRPSERIKDLHPGRLGQLRELIEPQKLHPSTRLIVMIQPAAETSESERSALQVGQALIPVLRNEAHESALNILGPYVLPCRLKGVPKRLYNRPEDAPLPNEPGEGMARVRIWVFRTDC